jgi:hypothetical protein
MGIRQLLKQLIPTVSLPQAPKNRFINPNTDGSFLLGQHIMPA